MPKIDDLILITGADIQMESSPVKIKQPTVKKIASIGEKEFFKSMNIFFIDDSFTRSFFEDIELANAEEIDMIINAMSGFDHLMILLKASITKDGEDLIKILPLVENVFKLMFPEYSLNFNQEEGVIILFRQDNSHSIVVDGEFFDEVRNIAFEIFKLETFFASSEQEEMSEAARKIAEKMAKTEQKIREMKGENQEGGYFARLISILGVHSDLNELSNLTVYQLHNKFERFGLHSEYEQTMKSALAGVKDVEVVDWYKQI